jgi:hypothetical protein
MLSVITLSISGVFQDVFRTEKIARADLQKLADSRLGGIILRRDLFRASPSFDVLNLPAKTPGPNSSPCGGSFFDLHEFASCEDQSSACMREYVLTPGEESPSSVFYFLTTLEDSDFSFLYEPKYAYPMPLPTPLPSPVLNRCNILGGPLIAPCVSSAPLPGGWSNDQLYLLSSIGTLPVRLGSPPQEQCVSNTSCSWSSNCTQSDMFPVQRPSSFLGYATGVGATGAGGSLNPIPPLAFIPNADPADLSSAAMSLDTFFKTLPSYGALSINTQIRKVLLVRYRLTLNKRLVRTEWQRNNNVVSWANSIIVAEQVKKLTFTRPSITTTQLNFKLEFERSL